MSTTAEKKEDGRPPRKDVYFLKLEDINIEEGFNVRQDYGDLKELSDSIESNGIRVPIRGYKKNGAYWITDGHRRYKAAKMLEKKGIEVLIPFLADNRGEGSQEQRVIDMLICNEGKKLNPVEEAEAISRLINYGFSEAQIRQKTGFSKVYICNLKLLQSAPQKLKNLIIGNIVSATLTMQVLREEKDFETAIEVIENAISQNSVGGDKKKITSKDIRKSKGNNNSYSALKKIIKFGEKKGLVVRQDKINEYVFAQKLNDGDYTPEQLLAELYEPEIVKEKKPKKKKGNKQAEMQM